MVKEFYITIQGWSGGRAEEQSNKQKGKLRNSGRGGEGASSGRELGEQGHRPPKMQSVCY